MLDSQHPLRLLEFPTTCRLLDRLCLAISAAPSLRHKGRPRPDSLAIDPEQLRVNQETRAARTSKVFANTNVRPPSSGGPSNVTMSTDEAFTENRQDRKRAFLNASADRRATSPDRLVTTSIALCCSGGTVIRRLSSRNPV
jgi:hypothetical protein